jgi:hypothetical protein
MSKPSGPKRDGHSVQESNVTESFSKDLMDAADSRSPISIGVSVLAALGAVMPRAALRDPDATVEDRTAQSSAGATTDRQGAGGRIQLQDEIARGGMEPS